MWFPGAGLPLCCFSPLIFKIVLVTYIEWKFPHEKIPFSFLLLMFHKSEKYMLMLSKKKITKQIARSFHYKISNFQPLHAKQIRFPPHLGSLIFWRQGKRLVKYLACAINLPVEERLCVQSLGYQMASSINNSLAPPKYLRSISMTHINSYSVILPQTIHSCNCIYCRCYLQHAKYWATLNTHWATWS